MLNLARGAFPLGIGAALVVVLLAFSFPAVSQDSTSSDAPTDAQCSDNWADSAADDTCRNESVTAEGGMCRVEAECKVAALLVSAPVNVPTDDNKTNQDNFFSNSMLATLDEVANLHNCNGVLTVGSC